MLKHLFFVKFIPCNIFSQLLTALSLPMKMHFRRLLFPFSATIFFQFANCQPAYDSLAKMAVNLFYQAIADNALLYNGTEYINSDPNIGGYPFLINEFQKSDLVYDNVTYPGVSLLYDILNDRVISPRYNNGVLMILISEKIKSFTLADHKFIRLTNDTTINASLAAGFYDLLYDGNTQVLVKYHKHLYESNTLEKSLVETTSYFIRKGGRYVVVKRKGDMLALFRDKKTDLKKYTRKNKLNYRKSPEETLIKVAAFYDQLKK